MKYRPTEKGDSPFHDLIPFKKKVGDMSFEKTKKYYDDDPAIKELMRIAQEGMLSYTWQEKLYAEIFHQMIIFDNIVDIDKLKKIVNDGLAK
jgi:hypothetical protein